MSKRSTEEEWVKLQEQLREEEAARVRLLGAAAEGNDKNKSSVPREG